MFWLCEKIILFTISLICFSWSSTIIDYCSSPLTIIDHHPSPIIINHPQSPSITIKHYPPSSIITYYRWLLFTAINYYSLSPMVLITVYYHSLLLNIIHQCSPSSTTINHNLLSPTIIGYCPSPLIINHHSPSTIGRSTLW